MLAFAQDEQPFMATTMLQNMERLQQESQRQMPDVAANWQARAELRAAPNGGDQVWLHVQAQMSMPLACQRCMGPVLVPLAVDQWFRFVDTEDTAMAQDDACDEDLLVMAPQVDLLALVEDELLMAIPLVPMHDECPVAPQISAGAMTQSELLHAAPEHKPNPFAALAQLKKAR